MIYYIEVMVNQSCRCGAMKEAFIVTGLDRAEAIEKVKEKLKTTKNYIIGCIYMCDKIDDNMYLAWTRYA